MEHVLDLIANGRAGYVAAMGMGGVFTALLFLFLFISSLGKMYRFAKLRGRKTTRPPPNPAQSLPEEPRTDRETAAALAVALALSGKSHRTGVSVKSGPAEAEPSPWKTAGRVALMQPIARPKKD